MSEQTPANVTSILSFRKSDSSTITYDIREIAELATKNRATSGLLNQFYGNRVEEPHITECFINWHSSTPPDSFDISSQPFNHVHVCFLTEPTKALEANITEILTATVKPDKDLNEFSKLTCGGISIMDGAKGYFGTSWGYALHDQRKVYIVTGWASNEVHQAFAQTESVQEILAPWLGAVTDIENYHVAFKHATVGKSNVN